MEAYQLRRTELTDPHLADRALLAGELALARWLLYGVRTQDPEIIDDAVAMLEELDAHTRDGPGRRGRVAPGVTDRSVTWGGLHNARDLGGLPAGTTVTRPGRIFRTPRLDGLDEQGWTELVDAGVRTIVDLRNPHEIEPLPLPAGVTRHHRPVEVWEDRDFMARWGDVLDSPEYYRANLEAWPELVVAAVRAVAHAPDGAVVIHCSAGRDRTGLRHGAPPVARRGAAGGDRRGLRVRGRRDERLRAGRSRRRERDVPTTSSVRGWPR